MKVWILLYSHKADEGYDITAYATWKLAREALADIARSWWHERGLDGVTAAPDGLSDEDVIRTYFENQGFAEHYIIDSAEVTGMVEVR